MKQMKVSFKDPKEVLEFVNCVTKYPFDMDMKRGHILIDAKSILGVIGLGMGNISELIVYNEECDTLEKDIEKYLVA
ncbi:HPr family phosphocarrier protein [Clostridium sp. MCC353]|uniref:HPr family phosphocarrier protein n=1 Tax=Clostridium sp. MCC353 TaxID=2592646 RepID=UPI001C033D1F|nr:HPr family phosphocarrier protein [Clostridium sp. MCC353]MBT9778957.1 HPr family phosphocarrier protein [Clostridium sp. MCC353]